MGQCCVIKEKESALLHGESSLSPTNVAANYSGGGIPEEKALVEQSKSLLNRSHTARSSVDDILSSVVRLPEMEANLRCVPRALLSVVFPIYNRRHLSVGSGSVYHKREIRSAIILFGAYELTAILEWNSFLVDWVQIGEYDGIVPNQHSAALCHNKWAVTFGGKADHLKSIAIEFEPDAQLFCMDCPGGWQNWDERGVVTGYGPRSVVVEARYIIGSGGFRNANGVFVFECDEVSGEVKQVACDTSALPMQHKYFWHGFVPFGAAGNSNSRNSWMPHCFLLFRNQMACELRVTGLGGSGQVEMKSNSVQVKFPFGRWWQFSFCVFDVANDLILCTGGRNGRASEKLTSFCLLERSIRSDSGVHGSPSIKWSAKKSHEHCLPTALRGHMATICDGLLHVIGGEGQDHFVFDLGTLSREQVQAVVSYWGREILERYVPPELAGVVFLYF